MTSPSKPLVVTAGDPAGIGPELCLAIAASADTPDFVIVSDAAMLRERAKRVGVDVDFDDLNIVDIRFPHAVECGKPDPGNSAALLDGIRHATQGCIDGEYAAMVTAPLAKSVIADSGTPFSGHTEFLAELTDTPLPVMLLVAGAMRVALASTHLPLRDVADHITPDRIQGVLEVLHADLQTKFGIAEPDIIVCGLNPHAGEGGHLGPEDDAVIAPVVEEFRDRGMKLRGPMPADTAFTPAAGSPDAVLAMYHDQGLPVIKHAGFGNAVNVTLGLPIIRTSVDHGTAFDLAGTGKADPGSLRAAIELAAELANAR